MLQQMFEVTAKIRLSSLKVKPMFTWKRRLLPGNAAHARYLPIKFNKTEKKR